GRARARGHAARGGQARPRQVGHHCRGHEARGDGSPAAGRQAALEPAEARAARRGPVTCRASSLRGVPRFRAPGCESVQLYTCILVIDRVSSPRALGRRPMLNATTRANHAIGASELARRLAAGEPVTVLDVRDADSEAISGASVSTLRVDPQRALAEPEAYAGELRGADGTPVVVCNRGVTARPVA